MFYKKNNKARGFAIGAILMVILLIGAVVGAMALANRGTTTDVSKHTMKIASSGALQQGINLRQGYDLMVAEGTAASTITFDATATTGLFNPVDGAAVVQTAPADILVSTPQDWVYKKTVQIMGVGTDGAADYMAVLPNVKLAACQSINNLLYGTTLSTSPSTLTAGTLANWQDGTAGTDAAIDLSADANVNQKAEGCFETFDNAGYVYYKVLYEQ